MRLWVFPVLVWGQKREVDEKEGLVLRVEIMVSQILAQMFCKIIPFKGD